MLAPKTAGRKKRKATSSKRTAPARQKKKAPVTGPRDLLSAVSQTLFSKLIDSPTRVIRKFHADGLPRNGDKSYNLFECLPWLKARWLKDSAIGGRGMEAESTALERQRLANAQRAELDLATRQGQVVELEEIQQQALNWAAEVRRKILSFRTLARKLENRSAVEVEEILSEYSNLILSELSGPIKETKR